MDEAVGGAGVDTGAAAGSESTGAGEGTSSDVGSDANFNSWFTTPPAGFPAKEEAKPDAPPPADAKVVEPPVDTTPATDAPPADGKASPDAEQSDLLAKAERYRETLARLEKDGLGSDEEIRARQALAADETEFNKQQKAIFEDLGPLVQAGRLTPEEAQSEYDRRSRLAAESIKFARAKTDYEAQQSDIALRESALQVSKAVEAYPELGEAQATPLVQALSVAGMGKPTEVAALLSEMLTKHGERAVAAYVAKTTTTAAAPASVGATGTPPATNPQKADPGRSWADILGIK